MKKVFVLILLVLNCCLIYSQKKEDPVVMTIAGKEVPLSEFLFLAQKDEGVNLSDKKSLENYVEMFKNFKLKVAEAESKRFHESINFQEELNKYKSQLIASYLSDKEGEAIAMHKVYERGNEFISASHIVFKLPRETVSKDTAEVYNKAVETYKRILAGEDFKKIGETFNAEENKDILYEEIGYMAPLQAVKALENAVYALSEGEISSPVRTTFGYHIIKVDKRIPNPGRIKVAHILMETNDKKGEQDDEEALKKANEVYEKAIAGKDFDELAKTYSIDKGTANEGGVLPYFSLGEMVADFEKAAFALNNVGEISKPVKTRYGYHILKLLDRKERPSYSDVERNIYREMKDGEWNFELFESFDEAQKKRFGYIFYQDAYNELLKLCDDYFPTDTEFYNRASQMTKTLMQINGLDFPQSEFAEYLKLYPSSTKTYSVDFLNEVYQLFIREIVTELERRTLNDDHPEFPKLMQEYRDGILLFEISSDRVWDKPVEEQAELEKQWIKELNNKFEAKIDWKVLKNIKNYI